MFSKKELIRIFFVFSKALLIMSAIMASIFGVIKICHYCDDPTVPNILTRINMSYINQSFDRSIFFVAVFAFILLTGWMIKRNNKKEKNAGVG